MKLRIPVVLAILILVQLPDAFSQESVPSSFCGRTEVNATLLPGNEPGTMVFSATISDLDTGEVLSAPTHRFNEGESSNYITILEGRTSPSDASSYKLVFKFDVGANGETATYSYTVTVGGTLRSSHTATYALSSGSA